MIGGGRRLAMGLVTVVAAAVPPRVSTRRQVVEIRGLAFLPAVLEVGVGDTVVWTNHDILPHTATGVANPKWSTGSIGAQASGRQVVRAKGRFDYYCELHPTMRATLVVK